MGNPRRFFGSDHPIHIDGVTIPARCAVEVTVRTHQQRFLLRPDEGASEIILGCFGRAYDRYPELNPIVLNVLSDHGSFIALPTSAFVLSSFMRDFLSTTAKRLNVHRDRDGTFWERRYRAIPIVDEPRLEERFAYVLTQGTKENLVWRARDWPGITSIKPLLGGKRLIGRWRHHTAEGVRHRQRARKIERAVAHERTLKLPKVKQEWREYPIELVPMPHWRELSAGQRRARVAAILKEDDEATRSRHERDRTRPLGVQAILATDPFARPANPAKSPAPLCHASTKAGRKAYRLVYRVFCSLLAAGRDTVKPLLPKAGVPLHGTLGPIGNHPPRPKSPPPVAHRAMRAACADAVGPPALASSVA